MSTTRSSPSRGEEMSTRYSVTGAPLVSHLLDQAEDRAAERHEVRELVAREHRGGVLEEDLRRLVGAGDAALRRRS